MHNKYMQTLVPTADYFKFRIQADKEKLTISELLEKVIKEYLERKEEEKDKTNTGSVDKN